MNMERIISYLIIFAMIAWIVSGCAPSNITPPRTITVSDPVEVIVPVVVDCYPDIEPAPVYADAQNVNLDRNNPSHVQIGTYNMKIGIAQRDYRIAYLEELIDGCTK